MSKFKPARAKTSPKPEALERFVSGAQNRQTQEDTSANIEAKLREVPIGEPPVGAPTPRPLLGKTKEKPTHQLTIRISEAELQQLRLMAEDEDRSVQKIARRVLRTGLQSEQSLRVV